MVCKSGVWFATVIEYGHVRGDLFLDVAAVRSVRENRLRPRRFDGVLVPNIGSWQELQSGLALTRTHCDDKPGTTEGLAATLPVSVSATW